MAAADHLGLQFQAYDNGMVTATHPEHGTVGELYWDPSRGPIESVETDPNFRPKGVARAMWDRAHQHAADHPHIAPPEHSTFRTPEGDAWARAVGGTVPPGRIVTF